jgi:trigger factor
VGVQLPPLAPFKSLLGIQIEGAAVKVNVSDVSGCTKEVQVEVPVEAVQAKVDGIYRRISQEAKLPGFRKGKAPLDVIRKQYKSSVREQMVQHELPEYFRAALNDRRINPVAQPQITHLQFEEGSPLKFVATVEIKPDFPLKDYKGLKVTKAGTEVKAEEADRALEALREQSASFDPVEGREARSGDLVLVDFEGKIDGKPFEGGKASQYPVLLGSNNLLKDFEANLTGMGKGQAKTFRLTFPADYGKKDVAGKEAEFALTLLEIKEKKLPELDDAFAKSAAQCATVKELREKVEAQLKSQKEIEQREKMVEQIGEKLIADHPFDVPSSLIQLEHQRLVRQGVERLRRQGVDLQGLSEEQKKEFVESLRPTAQKNVRMALVVEKIGDAEKIRCEDKDLEAYYEKIARNAGQSVDAVKGYVKKQGDAESVREWIQYEKVLDFLIAQAKVEAA